jgi:hypothetical protein
MVAREFLEIDMVHVLCQSSRHVSGAFCILALGETQTLFSFLPQCRCSRARGIEAKHEAISSLSVSKRASNDYGTL